MVPADKKLTPEWLKSLTDRGERLTYRGADLAFIGMPVGGLFAGQLYLGGDGRLWHWDIFNRKINTGSEHYAKPMKPSSPLSQGFALKCAQEGKVQERPLDAIHWKDLSFIGEYPIGYVSYRDPECPIAVGLEAFSPFIPLNTDDSSLPAVLFNFTLENRSNQPVEGEFAGWLENAVCLYSAEKRDGQRRSDIIRNPGFLFLQHSAEESSAPESPARPDLLFDDFERPDYGEWKAQGTAFGQGPVEAAAMPSYQGNVAAHGARLVNSHATATGRSVEQKDSATGLLTSAPFPIERSFIRFLIGGGNHQGRTCMSLLVEGKIVRSATGSANNQLQPFAWDVRPWAGKTGQLVIADQESGPWGNIGVDHIVFSDRPAQAAGPLSNEDDFGSMGLALLYPQSNDRANAAMDPDRLPADLFSQAPRVESAVKPFGQKVAGCLGRTFNLPPGGTIKLTFALAWHFPQLKMNRLPRGRFYGARFNSARAVVDFVATHHSRLASDTRLWHDTWKDSTLPHWFLDRTFLNCSILASSTCYRFGDGRFYTWEGVGCCEGTCGHVWQYAHATARLFPELERALRERIDLGLALQPDGAVHFRGEFNNIPAIDAQAGVVLRALREHQMSLDASFLQRNWPQLKKVIEWLIAKDANGDGLIESHQHNTLDTDWFGPVAWLSGLYLAAFLAGEAMALEFGDQPFAARCRKIFESGQKKLVTQLFDGEYFLNKVDPKHLDAINSGAGCEIDQVMGQSWAFQVGLPRVLPEQETRSALRSLWRYNFTPDVGPYRSIYKPGRWYAMPGEAGLLMCTFPRSDWDYAQAKGKGPEWAAGYFNECMNGFEYQAAGHMIWEGLVTEGFAVTRAVHDRYHPSKRNPWNEIECGDHYIRSMASYGVYLAACGYEYHGPKGRLAFAPRLTPEDFKAAFTVAEGWGSYAQKREPGSQSHSIEIKYGQLRLRTLAVELAGGAQFEKITAVHGGRPAAAKALQMGQRLEITFDEPLMLNPNAPLELSIPVG